MNFFIFTARDHHGKTITDKIDAENLGQARYALECLGFTEIEFTTGETENDVLNIFGGDVKQQMRQLPASKELEYRSATLLGSLMIAVKDTAIGWAPLIFIFAYRLYTGGPLLWPGIFLFAFTAFFLYVKVPLILFNLFEDAYNWSKWDEMRKWIGISKLFNKVSILKIPYFHMDWRLAGAVAAEGNLPAAISSMKKYENDKKVSRYLYNSCLYSLAMQAKDRQKQLEYMNRTLAECGERAETLLDYSLLLARFFKQPSEARKYVDKAYESELTGLVAGFASHAMGIVEYEDGNFERSEFHLLRAMEQVKSKAPENLLIGFYSLNKSYLAMIYAKTSDYQKAEKLYGEVKPFLVATRQTELIEDCEKAFADATKAGE